MKKDSTHNIDANDGIYSEFDYVPMGEGDGDEMTTDSEYKDNKSESSEEEKRKSSFLILLKILFSGTIGWKELRRSRLTPEDTAAGCFYPLAALASACRFADWFHRPEFSLSETLTDAVAVFVSFFFTYFGVQILCRWLFPVEVKDRVETAYFRQLVQYALASLALFWIPAEIFPVIEPLTVFLPLWTIFIITKGMRFLRIPQKYETRATITLVTATVAMPYLILWICDCIF